MKRLPRVFISGPYSAPDPAVNTRNAIFAGDRLMSAGCAVFVPHLSHFQNLVSPRPYEDWLAHDLEWLAVCDAVLLLPGHSPGADRECFRAVELGIQVFYSEAELLETLAKPHFQFLARLTLKEQAEADIRRGIQAGEDW